MGLFNKKRKVGIEEFCYQFYDNNIFKPVIAGQDFNKVWWDNVCDSIVEFDKSFQLIDKSVFSREITALRLELFGLAWVSKFTREKFTIPQSIFTRKYLERNGKLDIWDIMGEYGKIIAQSAFLDSKGKQVEGRTGRARFAFVNTFRMGIFNKWVETNISNPPTATTEEEKILINCVARVINRMVVDISRSDCVLVKLLAARLADRLGCNVSLNSKALFMFAAVVFGLYKGAQEAIKDIKLE